MTRGEFASAFLAYAGFALWIWAGAEVGFLEAAFIVPTAIGALIVLLKTISQVRRDRARKEWRE